MACHEHDLGVESNAVDNIGPQATECRSRHADILEDAARQVEAGDELFVPIARQGIHKRGRRCIGVFVCLHTAEHPVEIVGHHEEAACSLELPAIVTRERAELIGCVELLVLDARAPIVLLKGEDAGELQRVAHTVGAGITIAHAISGALVVLVEQHVVHGPGIDADGGRRESLFVRGGQAGDDVLGQRVDVPHKMPAVPRETILEAIDLGELHTPVNDPPHDVPPARCADVDGEMALLHGMSFPRIRWKRILY